MTKTSSLLFAYTHAGKYDQNNPCILVIVYREKSKHLLSDPYTNARLQHQEYIGYAERFYIISTYTIMAHHVLVVVPF